MDYPYFGGANDRERKLAEVAFDEGFTHVHTAILEPLAAHYLCGVADPLRCPCSAWLVWEQLGEEIWHDVERAWLPDWDAYDWLRWGIVALWHADHADAPMEIPGEALAMMPAAGELIAERGNGELKKHFRMYDAHARAAAREVEEGPPSVNAGLYDNFPNDWRSIPRPPDDRGALLYADRLFCIEDGEALFAALERHSAGPHGARWLPGGAALRFPLPMFCGASGRCANAIESPAGPIGTLIGVDDRRRHFEDSDRAYQERMVAYYREGWGHQKMGALSDGGDGFYRALTLLPPTVRRFYELAYGLMHYRNDVSAAWSRAIEAEGAAAPCIHRAYFSGDLPPGLARERYQPNLEAW